MPYQEGARVIWIAPGCIECFWCQQLAGEVFIHGQRGTEIRGAIRLDYQTNSNCTEQSPINVAVLSDLQSNFLQFVADGCPTKVIRLEGDWGTVGIADPAIG
jgi:ferredoxin